ncbi:MAG: methyltransferase [Candidatus Woesearchaeota archaeon]|nr:methyltransferase [Candidatus Woesearchaeota archaeon]
MSHYYSEKQDSPLRLSSFQACLRGKNFEFFTGAGVFSKSGLDEGSILLIEKCIMQDGWKILDLGCGYGAVGIALAGAFNSDVLMTDVNERALMLAKMNAEKNNVSARVLKSNCYDSIKDEKFDAILVNPPQTAGKEICLKIIIEAQNFLKNGGILQLVARHRKGGETLEKRMESEFGNVREIAKKAGYRIYVSVKK